MKVIQLFNSRLVASFGGQTWVGGRRRLQELTTMSMSKSSSSDTDTLHPASQNNHDDGTYTTTKTPVTTEWKTLVTQVGGHQFAHGEYEHQKLGIVDIGNGLILKSLQNPPRGTRELNFYQDAFNPNCDDTDLLELRPFLSQFHGTEEKDRAKFLKLTNLTSGFKFPCVIDLKMGRVTYDQEATAEKIAHEVEKYPPLKMLGFQITGMMIYNPVTQSNEQYGKPYCKILTEENITHDGLGRFFQLHNNDLRRDVIQQLVFKLKKLEAWFVKQKKFSFIASSLLIVYEGFRPTINEIKMSGKTDLPNTDQNKNFNNPIFSEDTPSNFPNTNPHSGYTNPHSGYTNPHSGYTTDINNTADSSLQNIHVQKRISDGELIFDKHSEGTSSESDTSQLKNFSTKEVEVRLIDFAHVFPANDFDHNFLFGLKKLIACLQALLK